MKTIFLSFCLLVLMTSIFGQSNNSISVSYIRAIPVGDFKKQENKYVATLFGYAKSGSGFDLSFLHKSKSNFGYIVSLRTRENNIDTAGFFYNSTRIPMDWQKNIVKWKVYTLMAGGSYSLPLSEKWSLSVKIIAGIAKAKLPAIDWSATAKQGFNGQAFFKRDEASSNNLSTCFSAGLCFKLNKRFSILANAEYWYLKPTFEVKNQSYLEVYGSNSYGGGGDALYVVEMSSVNINTGVAFTF